MSKQPRISRRDFVGVALGISSAVLLPRWSVAAEMQSAAPMLMFYDPSRTDARGLADAAAQRGTVTRAITGDRIRFAREQIKRAPSALAGITGHADFILLSGCAAEVGYRLVQEYRYPLTRAQDAQGALVFWVVAQRRLSAV